MSEQRTVDLIAKFITTEVMGYAWDGLRPDRINPEFKPLIYSSWGGLKIQGGQEDMRDIARKIIDLMSVADFDGRPVQVKGSDYAYEGRLCVAFRKSTGAVRFIVEDQSRRLFVHNAEQTGLRDLAGDRVLIPLTPEQQAEWADQMRGHSEDPRWLDLPRAYGPYGDEHPDAGQAINVREPGEFGDGVTIVVAPENAEGM